ncbi:transmembrane protein 17B-like isoform X2 [Prorops nasuta]|uniref:transmembrane protein 17B-like isoform X2 n=1 Tax=Prorops nasuta TaxID=863751 RepID=UPI0034CF8A1E
MLKTSITNVSNHIFPGLIYYDQKEKFYELGNQVRSNLPLQMALYFNVWVLPIWFIVLLIDIDDKVNFNFGALLFNSDFMAFNVFQYYYLSDAYKFITVAVFLVVSVLECARLYLGYKGNLQEKIPELASFWLLSTLIQFPLEIFLLLDNNTRFQIIRIAISGLMLSLLIIEIIAGTIALKTLADYHAKRFYVAQLYGINR